MHLKMDIMKKQVSFLSVFRRNLKKTNQYLEEGVLTGIMKVIKTGIDLNNLTV